MSPEGYHWVRHDAVPPPDAAASPCSQWQVRGLPPGFRLTANARQVLAGQGKVVTHLVFSDGLASVSVFCESQGQLDAAQATGNVPADAGGGEARVGTTSAVTTMVDGHRVTAIGEVPPATVRAIAGSIQPAGPTGPPLPAGVRRR
jgi:sigma-E factor negative regulatory protein RseB